MKKIIILILLASVIEIFTKTNNYVKIPSSSIRIRVIAASDSKNDQDNKMIIKSAIEEELYKLIGNKKEFTDVDETIKNNKENIDRVISNTIDENKMATTFTTNYGYNYFPEKTYKEITYDAGIYKSLVVTLGNGEGANWWCVLYPPLCLIDENVDDYEYHLLIKDTLEQYN